MIVKRIVKDNIKDIKSDKRISLRSKGLYFYLLRVTSFSMSDFLEDRKTIQKSINELKAYGYLSNIQGRDKKGRFVESIYMINI